MCSEFEYKTNNSSWCGLLLVPLLSVLLSFVCNYKNPKHRQKLICSAAHKIIHTQHQRPVQNSPHFRNNQTSTHFTCGQMCVRAGAHSVRYKTSYCVLCAVSALLLHTYVHYYNLISVQQLHMTRTTHSVCNSLSSSLNSLALAFIH